MGKKAKKWKRRARRLRDSMELAWQQAREISEQALGASQELERLRGECEGLRQAVAVERDVSVGLQRKLDRAQFSLDRALFAAATYPPHLVPALKGIFDGVVGIVDDLLPERAGEIIYDDPKTVPDLRPQMRRLRNEARRALVIIEQESKREAGK